MLPSDARFAVYFTPERRSALWRFGTDCIGYDPHDGSPRRSTIWEPLSDLLQPEHFSEPARYGFHATLRAPFYVRPGTTLDDLITAARRVSEGRSPIMLPALEPRILGGFIALVCPEPPRALGELAADCVRELERLRAPLSDADRQRRLQARLTARQIANVEAWGYPYVFEDYFFHMTLTGKLPAEKSEAALSRIAQAWQSVAGPFCVDSITILEQPQRDLSFRVIERLPLSGT